MLCFELVNRVRPKGRHRGPTSVNLDRSVIWERNCTPLLPMPSASRARNFSSKSLYACVLHRKVCALRAMNFSRGRRLSRLIQRSPTVAVGTCFFL